MLIDTEPLIALVATWRTRAVRYSSAWQGRYLTQCADQLDVLLRDASLHVTDAGSTPGGLTQVPNRSPAEIAEAIRVAKVPGLR